MPASTATVTDAARRVAALLPGRVRIGGPDAAGPAYDAHRAAVRPETRADLVL